MVRRENEEAETEPTKTSRSLMLALTVIYFIAVPTLAQTTEPSEAATPAPISYTGEAVPLYFVVDHFFHLLENLSEMGEGEPFFNFLQNSFGFEKDSQEAQVVLEAVRQVREIHENVRPGSGGYTRDNWLRGRVQQVRTLYDSLNSRLGSSFERKLDAVLESEIRPVISFNSSSGPATEILEIVAEFERP